jgi:hypothetical protein
MKTKQTLLIVMSLILTAAIPSWGTEPGVVDPKELGRRLLTRIERLQSQRDAINGMIGETGAYKGFAKKSVQKALDTLGEDAEGDDAHFLAALKDCQVIDSTLDPATKTLEDLLKDKENSIAGILRYLEEQKLDIEKLREESETEKLSPAAQIIETAPSQSDLFREDLYANADRAKLLFLHLNRENLREFVDAQNGVRHDLCWGEPTKDERLKVIFSVAEREYKHDDKYLWFGLIDILNENIGVNIDNVDPYLKKLGYEDTWEINGHFQGTHNKVTPDAVRSYRFDREGSRLGIGRNVTEPLSRLFGKFRL